MGSISEGGWWGSHPMGGGGGGGWGGAPGCCGTGGPHDFGFRGSGLAPAGGDGPYIMRGSGMGCPDSTPAWSSCLILLLLEEGALPVAVSSVMDIVMTTHTLLFYCTVTH